MSLNRYSTEDLIKEVNERVVGGKEWGIPIDTRENHSLLQRDSRGRFVKS